MPPRRSCRASYRIRCLNVQMPASEQSLARSAGALLLPIVAGLSHTDERAYGVGKSPYSITRLDGVVNQPRRSRRDMLASE